MYDCTYDTVCIIEFIPIINYCVFSSLLLFVVYVVYVFIMFFNVKTIPGNLNDSLKIVHYKSAVPCGVFSHVVPLAKIQIQKPNSETNNVQFTLFNLFVERCGG